MGLAEDIKHKALASGFDLVGITDASPVDAEHVELLAGWLKSGFAGQMSYLHRNFEKRVNPGRLLEDARSVICVGLNCNPPKQQPKPSAACSPAGRVASYAQYEDYHLFMKRELRKLVDFIISIAGSEHKFKVCVDSAPLAERALAARAGLGFIGKNHMLTNPKLGGQLLLGEIITNLKLKPDGPAANGCSGCDRCITACPTGALQPDGQFDANKCVSYLTIEYKGPVPSDIAEKIGDRLFGCDECVLACPYQEDAPLCANRHFMFYEDRAELDLRGILDLHDKDFGTRFANSVIKRLGLERLKRNARIVLANITGP